MSKGAVQDWRESRRQSARLAILDAAWGLVREHGLAALSLRDLAGRAGITTPTVYAYFESKNQIYDAMFGQAAAEFEAQQAATYDSDDPEQVLVESVRRFFDFCTSDPARYHLLFQRTVPGFEPSAESYAPAVRALADAHARLARNGVVTVEQVDLWTALVTGLVDQQIANDPGGQRWTRLIDDAMAMFLAHCAPAKRSSTARVKARS